MSTTRRIFSNEYLEPFRNLGDPLADAAIAAVFSSNAATEISKTLHDLHYASDSVRVGLLPQVTAFLDANDALRLPPWADLEQLALGAHLFTRHSPEVITILHCASLPVCYAAWRGVQVLGRTKRLKNFTKMRILETARFLFDVMDEQGFTAAGTAIRACQKVRLLHATIRYHVQKSEQWNPEYGLPINQEDLALTLMSFSVTVIESLEKLGVCLPPAQIEAYLHRWKVIGYFMGIDERLLPLDYAEAVLLTYAIQQRQYGNSETGAELTRALLDSMQPPMPFKALSGFPATLMRLFLGDKVADWLEVPGRNTTELLLGPYKALLAAGEHATGHCKNLEWLKSAIGAQTLRYVHDVVLHRMHFEMNLPCSAADTWQPEDNDPP